MSGTGVVRRLGVIVLVIGLAGFLYATSQRRGYDTIEGAVRAAVSVDEARARHAWETARWLALGAAVIGAVLVVLPGRGQR